MTVFKIIILLKLIFIRLSRFVLRIVNRLNLLEMKP